MKTILRIAAVLLVLVLAGGVFFYLHPLWVLDQKLYLRLWHEGVQSKYVDVPAGRVHYDELAAAPGTAGTPLLLIHGLGARAEDWNNLMPGLAANGFHVYAPDLLGYGRSAKPNVDFSIPFEESVVLQFMQAMHLKHADVGGWSMGGWIVLQFSLDHPEHVDRLVVYDSAGLTFVPSFGVDLFTPTDLAGLERLQEKLTPHPAKLPGFIVRDALRKLQRNAPIVGPALTGMMTGRDVLDSRLGALKPPMLIVWGAEDKLIPVSVAENMHTLVPQSQLDFVPGCGHLAPSECPAPVLEDTVQFLRGAKP